MPSSSTDDRKREEEGVHIFKGEKSEVERQSDIDRVKFVAKMFMDSRFGLMDDLNYDLPVTNYSAQDSSINDFMEVKPDLATNKKKQDTAITSKLIIPKSVRVNANRVKNYLDYYYAMIEKNINMIPEENVHEGVDGVYNPLQIIRNRKLREKYDELPPRALFISKSPVIAVKQFSSKSNKKFPWYVDISERSSDMIWRTTHWHELVGHNKELLFPPERKQNNNNGHSRNHMHLLHTGHHTRPPLTPANSATGLSQMPNLSKENSDLTPYESPISYDSSHHTSEEKSNNIPDKSGSPENKERKVDQGSSDNLKPKKIEKIIEKSKKWSRSPSFRRKSHIFQETPSTTSLNRSMKSNSVYASFVDNINSGPPMSPVDELDPKLRESPLKDIQIRNIRSKNNLSQPSSREIYSNENAIESEDEYDSENGENMLKEEQEKIVPSNNDIVLDARLQQYWRDVRYVNSTIDFFQHRMITHRKYKKKELEIRNKINFDDDINEVIHSTSDVLNVYNNKLENVIKEGNEWNSKWLNDYSARVETLISSTDRIISDISTTLTLKLKLFQENAEKLETVKSMRSRQITKLGYRILEFFIILILWSIWLVVSIIKDIKYLGILVLRVIKWTLW
ncbi:hypothetical protein Kpol_182p3 [Vanderwaltozyma polyspora DSM 70294]|uniref:Maintenance of telomere capping protein 4 n=1 Tax=Vanderwaltozyma polyspora (strain ATCC 22028 / DSM 70294 / BCRC 21397 / CBS 2163 / NBRC 10782 / NRRL Y-8283 / UCD 57-17) TaxID=436907 RepID=A7TTR3_VANPO|nr:uncharacterized protein Kpol_182p3 [Vanderwaltozyma polyspora DSM 70294]EDO14345.1 hypothetical protein Kpol_182p3 [Vanderwaltozyma polyspora DSM 70294]